MNNDLIGYCGIYCGACDHYLSTTTGKHLTKGNDELKQNPCKRCKSTIPEKICKWCRNCDIKICAREKKLSHCGECKEFPCNRIEFFEKGLQHHQEAYKRLQDLILLSEEEWVKEQEDRWRCCNCGKQFSYYELKCNKCGNDVLGLFPDERRK